MSENCFYVYVLLNARTAQPVYVGKGKGYRMFAHGYRGPNHYNQHLSAIIEKDDVIPVKIREGLSEGEAFDMEIAFISAIGRHPYGPLVNQTDGGDGVAGRPFPEHAKIKLSAERKGKPRSEEVKAKMRAAWADPEIRARKIAAIKAAHARPDTKARHREAWDNPELKARQSANSSARKHTPESIEKMRQVQKGRTISDDHRAKISATLTGRKLPPERVEKMREIGKNFVFSNEHRAKISAGLVRRMSSEEEKEKVRQRNRERGQSEESKAKISRANTGKKRTPEQRAALSEIHRARWARRKTQAAE